MLVEHDFITTLPPAEAMKLASTFLAQSGFRIREASEASVNAVRGKARAVSKKVVQLPQYVTLAYDRGRVTVAAAIEARGGRDKPVHHNMVNTMALFLERLLSAREPMDLIVRERQAVDAAAGTIWGAGDYIAWCLLILLLLGIAGMILFFVVVD